ncbi:MAG: MaoC family dehydratase [Gammaproteobacteria bacterium]|nr:MaoC family dehydratase [Gammaproteobacteria bacterium]
MYLTYSLETKVSDSKINKGNYFEDFKLHEKIIHPLPRTISDGDVSLYIALTGSRFALHSSVELARSMGYKERPVDDILLFHLAFGKSVVDISLNALANLGYAEVIFPDPVFVGDTVRLESTVIGLKENSNARSGNVYVHSQGYNQHGELILSFKRWVMVHKKDYSMQTGIHEIPSMEAIVPVADQLAIPPVRMTDISQTGSPFFWEDYVIGERLDHPEGITIDNSDHTLATKLYQNNAKLHFDDHMMKSEKMGQRLMYGGHVISICRSISFNGLGNALWLYAINSGTHANPTFGGDTLYCYSEVLDVIKHHRKDIGLLRLRTIGLKNITPKEVSQARSEENKYHSYVVLDLDYTVVIPKRNQ